IFKTNCPTHEAFCFLRSYFCYSCNAPPYMPHPCESTGIRFGHHIHLKLASVCSLFCVEWRKICLPCCLPCS
uniref:Uncharacterized protein n=1 Tax=Macaca nemestrina TaxID=9545 RepID=A0A2K6CLE4_MACNE